MRRLRYSDVASTLALFVALGGASYAAVTIPRHSVGARELRPNAVSSATIKDRSIQTRDMQTATLQRAGGLWAQVSDAGAMELHGTAATRVSKGLTGQYAITFARDVSKCAALATLSAGPPAIVRTFADTAKATNVIVHTFTTDPPPNNQPIDAGFKVAVFC